MAQQVRLLRRPLKNGIKGGTAVATAIKKSQKKSQPKPKAERLTKVHTKELVDEFNNYSSTDQRELLKALGIGTDWLTCQLCGEPRKASEFYGNTDPMNKSNKTYICKKCCERIVYLKDDEGKKHNPTKDSIKQVLQYLDKPYLDTVYEASMTEAANTFTGKTKSDVWLSYAKNIAMVQYNGLRFKDSDIFGGVKNAMASSRFVDDLPTDKEIVAMYEQNKKDTIRLLGYDPFQTESLAEQPFLYATLIGYLDASPDANEDRMRVSSIVEIVKGFNHIEKINEMITSLLADKMQIEKNMSTIKSMEDTKNKITTSILNLAKDNGISLKHSVNGSKGENTLTGMSKRLKGLNLREDEVNKFDIGTTKGMRQVADIIHASILKQIHLDENDYTEMLADQRTMIKKLQEDCNTWQEKSRILLRENIDLKAYLQENGLLDESMLSEETILYENEDEEGDIDE